MTSKINDDLKDDNVGGKSAEEEPGYWRENIHTSWNKIASRLQSLYLNIQF